MSVPTLREIARLPLPAGPYGWDVVADASTFVQLGSATRSGWSLLDGARLWERPATGVSAQVLGCDAETLVLQEQRRGPGSRWLEGVDVGTGRRRWWFGASIQAMGGGPVIDGHLYAACPFEPGSLRVELASGRTEVVDVRPRVAGPGGWYGVAKHRLVRFDGTTHTDLGPAPKLALLGVAGSCAVLAQQSVGVQEVVLVHLLTGARGRLLLGGPHVVLVRAGRIVIAGGRTSDAVGIDPEAVSEDVPLDAVVPAWRTPDVTTLSADRVGPAFFSPGLGLVSAEDGRVLLRDPDIDRACGTASRWVVWSSRDSEARLVG